MTEHQMKAITKFCLVNGHRKLTYGEKELIKLAIDQSSSLEELLKVMITSLGFDFNR